MTIRDFFGLGMTPAQREQLKRTLEAKEIQKQIAALDQQHIRWSAVAADAEPSPIFSGVMRDIRARKADLQARLAELEAQREGPEHGDR